MSRARVWVAIAVVGAGCLLVPGAHSQPASTTKTPPKMEPVADTKLLMEGLAGANMRGLGNLLRDKPRDAEGWAFARGQALLIGETGNLLLLRPPRAAAGQEAWVAHATEMRTAAVGLARAAAAKDYATARAGLAGVANACNRCHQTFRIPTRIDPFAED